MTCWRAWRTSSRRSCRAKSGRRPHGERRSPRTSWRRAPGDGPRPDRRLGGARRPDPRCQPLCPGVLADARPVDAGEAMPPGSDAVAPPEAVTLRDGIAEVMAPVAPGDGVLSPRHRRGRARSRAAGRRALARERHRRAAGARHRERDGAAAAASLSLRARAPRSRRRRGRGLARPGGRGRRRRAAVGGRRHADGDAAVRTRRRRC